MTTETQDLTMLTPAELKILLREKGFRITPQREKILDIFYELPEGDHLSAEDLQNRLKSDSSDISLATSYRTLKLLASLDVLRELDFGEDQKFYELVRDEADLKHQHILCLDCGATKEFTSEDLFCMAQNMANALNFELVDTQLRLLGHCRLLKQCGFCETQERLNKAREAVG